jgi:ABC-type multidrug transport system fused ATPase/permease subunit
MTTPLSATSIATGFAKENPGKVTTLGIVSLAYPINMVISPILVGKLSKSISSSNYSATIISLTLLISINVVMILAYNADLHLSEAFACDMSAYVKRELMKYYFDTHDIGSDSALNDEISHNMRVFSDSVNLHFDVIRGTIAPIILSALFQSVFMFAFIDKILGIAFGGMLVAMLTASISAAYIKFDSVSDTALAHAGVYRQIDEMIDSFSTIISTPGAREAEIVRMMKIASKKCDYKRRATKDVIRFTSIFNAVIGGLAALFGYRFFKKFIQPMRNGASEPIMIDKAVTSAAMFFSILSSVRTVMYNVFFIVESMMRIDITRKNFISSTASSTPTGNLSALWKSGDIEITNMTHHFKNSPIFENASVTFPHNKITALVGRNGGGKTTLLKMIMRHLEPTAGVLKVGGQDMSKIGTLEMRRKIAYSTQKPDMFNRSVLENIIYPLPPSVELRKKVVDFIDSLGLSPFIANLESGLDTQAGKRGEKLSGGQRQIIQLLRVIFRNECEVLLFDEATSAVDVFHKRLVLQILKSPALSNKTIIAVTHDQEMIDAASCVIDVEQIKRLHVS